MKEARWRYIKRGDFVIRADEYDGVFRAQVIEVDIRIKEPDEPGGYSWPYGMTAETGTLRIRYDTTEEIANLADLIEYSTAALHELQLAYRNFREKQDEADELKDTLLAAIARLKG